MVRHVRRDRQRRPCHQVRRADREQRVPGQALRHQAGPLTVAPANLHVIFTVQLLDPDIADVANIDMRMRLAEPRQLGCQPVHEERQAATHLDRSTFVLTKNLVGPHGQSRDRILHHRQISLAFLGQSQATGQALEQCHSKVAFQLADLLTDRALGQKQFFGGMGEVQTAGRHLECP
ncbi:hypothetical protein D3C84_344080 [compost metagenome]